MGLNRNQTQYFVKVATGLAQNNTDPPIKIVRARDVRVTPPSPAGGLHRDPQAALK